MIRVCCIFFLSLLISVILRAEADIVVSNTACNNRPTFFSYRNYYDDEIIFQKIQRDKDWYYIKSDHPILLIFSREFSLYPVYAFPGDTIQVRCSDAIERPFEFYGNRKTESLNILSQIESRIGFLTPTLNINITNNLNLDYWLTTLDSIHSQRIASLDLYYTDNGKEKNLYRAIFTFRLLVDKLRPFYATDSSFDWRKLPDPYIKMCYTYASQIENDSLIFDTKYRSFIWNYNKFLSRISEKGDSDFSLFQSAMENFTGASRDYLLFRIIKENIDFYNPDKKRMMDDFKKICINSKYKAYIDSLQSRMLNLPSNQAMMDTKLLSLNSGSLSFKQLLEKYKGNLIYIDFWASWCAPCIREFVPLKELAKRFEGNKVFFVSVSIDSDASKWLISIDKHDLNTEHQYLISQEGPLHAYFDLSAIPRFILIGRDGAVLNMNAPKPSNLELVEKTLRSALWP